MKMRMDMIF